MSRGSIETGAVIQVKNVSGETIPAVGIARITTLSATSPLGQPVLSVNKPDGSDSLYVVVIGTSLINNAVGTAVRLLDATTVLCDEAVAINPPDEVGPVSGSWKAGPDGAGLIVLSGKGKSGTRAVIGNAATTTVAGGGGAGGCPCTCIADGSAIVNGMETASTWSIAMNAETFEGEFGDILFPAGTYDISLNTAGTAWTQDIGNLLTATYLDGSSATADTTMDGTLTMTWGAYGPVVTLCVDGAVPDPEA